MSANKQKTKGACFSQARNELKQEIIEIGRKMVNEGLVITSFGNISHRSGDKILITPSRLDYFAMEPSDIVEVNLEGKKLFGPRDSSSELLLHLEIYKQRTDVKAIVHTHSLYATALSCLQKELPAFTEELEYAIKGSLKTAPFAPAGTLALAQNAAASLGKRNAVLLERHGVVGVGVTLKEAFTVCQIVERNAQLYLTILQLGELKPKD